MLWGEIEETVSWVVASGLGVSGGEAMGTEKTQGSHLCSENAAPPHTPRQKMTVVAQVQGGGFCKWSMPKPPPFKEVDLSMGGGGGGGGQDEAS